MSDIEAWIYSLSRKPLTLAERGDVELVMEVMGDDPDSVAHALIVMREELAALRARHEKLREGLRATIARIDEEAKELPQEDWEEAFGLSVLAEELNALLEDE